MSFADLILRRPMWEHLAQELQLTLLEGGSALALYDQVAELMHGEGARFPQEAQQQVEQSAERMKALIAGAGQRSRLLGALASVLVPTGLAIRGQWGEGATLVAVVPDHLKASVHPDSRLVFAAFQEKPLDLGLEVVPEDPMFQAARPYTGAQDIQTGMSDLDGRAIIRGADESEVRRRLRQPEVHQAVMALLQDGRCQINDRGALLMVSSATARGGQIRPLLDRLVEAVRVLSR